MNLWQRHKTKALGFLAMIIGAAQVNFEDIRNMIPPHWRGLVLFGFGMAAAIIGFINSHKDEGQ